MRFASRLNTSRLWWDLPVGHCSGQRLEEELRDEGSSQVEGKNLDRDTSVHHKANKEARNKATVRNNQCTRLAFTPCCARRSAWQQAGCLVATQS
jgi:hypothetical protein